MQTLDLRKSCVYLLLLRTDKLAKPTLLKEERPSGAGAPIPSEAMLGHPTTVNLEADCRCLREPC